MNQHTYAVIAILSLSGAAVAQNSPPPQLDETARRVQVADEPWQADRKARNVQTREQFLLIERTARLPADVRRAEIPRIYRELGSELLGPGYSEWLSSTMMPADLLANDRKYLRPLAEPSPWIAQLESLQEILTPEQVADAIVAAHRINILTFVTRRRCIDLLQNYPGELKKLIDTDLGSGNVADGKRALNVIGSLALTAYEPKILEIENAGKELSREAKSTRLLLAMNKSRRDKAATQPAIQPNKQD